MPAALVLGALLLLAGAVQAALPVKGASFKFHDHETAGQNWHVEFVVDPKNPKRLETLVAYSQQCKGTIAKTGVPISDAGVVAASGGLRNYGWWEVNATFVGPEKLVGTLRMRRTGCDTGPLSFPNATTGDGTSEHEDAGHDHGQAYPDFDKASFKQRKQARGLHRRVLKIWRGMTLAKAKRLGFHRLPGAKPLVGLMFHMYNQRHEHDRRIFDAKRPESLVFWRQANGDSVILGPMFRVPAGRRPSFAGPIPLYHGHEDSNGDVPNQMTHVWMVKGSKSAWANCLPVWQLEQYNPAFKWTPQKPHEHVGQPCPDSVSASP